LSTGQDLAKFVVPVEDHKVRLLHLSDAHFVPTSIDAVARVEVLEKLRERWSAWKSAASFKGVDGFVFTGDAIAANRVGKIWTSDRADWVEGYETAHRQAAEMLQDFATKDLRVLSPRAVLVVPGNHDVLLKGHQPLTEFGQKPSRLGPFFEEFAERFVEGGGLPFESASQVTDPWLLLLGNEEGIVVVAGLDSNHGAYRYRGLHRFGYVWRTQLEKLRKVVDEVARRFEGRPVYLIAALHHHLLPVEPMATLRLTDAEAEAETAAGGPQPPIAGGPAVEAMVSVTLNSREVIERFHDVRASLVLHGHMHLDGVQQVSYIPWAVQAERASLNVVACPSYSAYDDDRGGVAGATMLSLDLQRGEVVTTVLRRGPSGDGHTGFGATFPLLSCSRVSSGERRVYRELTAWLDDEDLPSGRNRVDFPPVRADHPRLKDFRAELARTWEETGYTLVCDLPISPDWEGHRKKYRLLVLLRIDGGETYVLLNPHRPLRKSDFGRWDAPLLPAFHGVGEFLRRLEDDLLHLERRLIVQPATSLKRREEQLDRLAALRATLSEKLLEDLDDELRHLSSRVLVKFSPTDAKPFAYEYSLVSLDKLALAKTVDGSLHTLFDLFPRTNSAEINRGALRWEPGEDHAQAVLAPGPVWFPLRGWEDCHAIRARNADIMRWLEQVVDRLSDKVDGQTPSPPAWLRLGGLTTDSSLGIEVLRVEARPPRAAESSAETEAEEDPPVPAPSLEEGLRRVRLNPGMDLRDERPYRDSDIELVEIRKVELDGQPRLLAYRREPGRDGEALGVVRPVQRYVLRKGLERVERLEAALGRYETGLSLARIDGFVRLTLKGSSEPLCCLPPILEEVVDTPNESWSLTQGIAELLVCDGNHRIVHFCWTRNESVWAVLLRRPSRPYYAHPFSQAEWDVTSRNEMPDPPDLYSKYHPRRVPDEEFDVAKTSGFVPHRDRYRRYFRDFSTAFGFIGGQGGRMC
jgi:hypothetical protein